MFRRCMNKVHISPTRKGSWFSDTELLTQQCNRNMQQNNLRFLHGIATYGVLLYVLSPYLHFRQVNSSFREGNDIKSSYLIDDVAINLPHLLLVGSNNEVGT